MYKKTITYTDYDGNKRTENLYFHLKKSKLIELEVKTPGGIEQKIRSIVEANDVGEMIDMINEFMRLSYGVKSEDGKRFIQQKNGVSLFDEFRESEAYEAYMDELLGDEEEAARLVNGSIPANLNINEDELKAAQKEALADLTNKNEQ